MSGDSHDDPKIVNFMDYKKKKEAGHGGHGDKPKDADGVWDLLESGSKPETIQDLYADHSDAHGKGVAATHDYVKGIGKTGTIGLSRPEQIEAISKFIASYDETVQGKVEGVKAYRKVLKKGEAEAAINDYAQTMIRQGRARDIDDVHRLLQREGLDDLLAQYSTNNKSTDKGKYFESLLTDVDTMDYDLTKSLAARLKKENPNLQNKQDFLIQGNIKQYLINHFVQYHENQPVKYEANNAPAHHEEKHAA